MTTKIFDNRNSADALMRLRNKASKDNTLWVLVDGPSDGQFAVMLQQEAIGCGFAYEWGF